MTFRQFFSFFAVLALLATSACSATSTQESTGEMVDSTVVSTKVRAAIAADDQLSIFPIDVETYRGVVQLSGFVNSAEEKRRAEQVASGIDGVRQVQNDLVVKTTTN